MPVLPVHTEDLHPGGRDRSYRSPSYCMQQLTLSHDDTEDINSTNNQYSLDKYSVLGVPSTYSGYPQHPGREMGTAPQGCASERLFFANHWCASDHAPPVLLPRAKTTIRYQPVRKLDHVVFRTDQSRCRYRPHSATCSNRTPWRRQARGSTLCHRSRTARRCDVLLQPQALSFVCGVRAGTIA